MITVVLTLHSIDEILYNYLFSLIEKSHNNFNNNNNNNNNINNNDADNDNSSNKISSFSSCVNSTVRAWCHGVYVLYKNNA